VCLFSSEEEIGNGNIHYISIFFFNLSLVNMHGGDILRASHIRICI
jgi:hypothetical protein